jgi:lipid A 3-O-deacylase
VHIRALTAIAASVPALLLASPRAMADDGSLLAIGAGAYNVLQDKKEAEFRLEYRSALTLLHFIEPIAGVLATDRGSLYGYGGLRIDLMLGSHVVLTPSAAVGLWRTGSGKELGSTVEFKTGAELAWRFADASRLGISFDHISNAGLTKHNPGVESLLLVYSLPLGWTY